MIEATDVITTSGTQTGDGTYLETYSCDGEKRKTVKQVAHTGITLNVRDAYKRELLWLWIKRKARLVWDWITEHVIDRNAI